MEPFLQSTPPPPGPGCAAGIAFFDVETTRPTPEWPRRALLEFGVILVCPRTLVHLGTYSTLIRPFDLPSLPPSELFRSNGITPEAIAAAPHFSEVASIVFRFLDGRVWAGHNVEAFDSARIREAFAGVGMAAPQPSGFIDSLPLLRRKFGRRTTDMQMATLATHFGLGRQLHRCLDDVRMNIEILKCCGMLLLLEPEPERPPATSNSAFQEIREISLDLIGASLVPARPSRTGCKIQLLHRDSPLQIRCPALAVRYGPNRRYCDAAGRPKLSFLVEADPVLCMFLDACENIARTMSLDSGSSSGWTRAVEYNSTCNAFLARLRIPGRADTDDIAYATEVHRRFPSGETCVVVFDRLDEAEQDQLFLPGTLLDAYIRLDAYDSHEKAGILLVVERLVIHCT
ncbi:hypothetical protein Taro_025236 [Colocasia esculenta]|uniref:Exonuclease domain-containing protein n=1 Tax=Colocasia esculenta TaxID=4460 RepID=A0A843VDN7_COLES|nr:hypothetical protein [Colocasia esculenta]